MLLKGKYQSVELDAPDRSKQLACLCALVAHEDRVLKVEDLCSFTDYFVIATGSSGALLKAVVSDCEMAMKQCGVKKLGVEGGREGHWALVDFGEVIVQALSPEAREFYQLEELWGEAPDVDWQNGVISNSNGDEQ